MSEVILSPGVFQIESDQSLYTQAPQVVGAAIVGPTVSGRPMIPTYVTTYNQYLSLFGDIFKNGSYYYEYFTSMTAREYFNNGGQTLLVTRIISGSDYNTYAQSSVPSSVSATAGTKATAAFSLLSSDTGSKAIQLGIPGVNNYYVIFSNSFTAGAIYYNTAFDYVYIGTSGSTTLDTVGGYVTASINNNASFFNNNFSASYNAGTLTITATTTANQNTTPNSNWFVSSSLRYIGDTTGTKTLFSGGANGTVNNSFVLETLSWGDQMNNSGGTEVNGALPSGSAQNIRWEVTNVNSGSDGGTFTLVVRRGDDNTSQKNILETWANMSLDPQLPNYIGRVIGDLKPEYNASEDRIVFKGTYPNISRYVRVSSVVTPNVDSLDNNGNYKTGSYALTLPQIGSGSFSGGVAATNATTPLFNELIGTGTDYSADNIQGFTANDYTEAFALLSNKDEYQFNVLMAPGIGLDTSAADNMIATVESRGDAIAIVDTGKYGTAINQATQNAAGSNSNYAATYYPWVQLYSSNLGKSVWCPPSTVIGGVLAFNDQVGAEWFAPAGLNRGGIPSVVLAERRLSQSDRDTLYSNKVNPIATFPGQGVVVYGHKTLQTAASALDRVNVHAARSLAKVLIISQLSSDPPPVAA